MQLRRVEAALEFEELPRAVPVEFPAQDPWRNIELTEADTSSVRSVPMAVPAEPVEPAAPVIPPLAVRKSKGRPASWTFVVLWGLLGLLTLGTAIGMFQHVRKLNPPPPVEEEVKEEEKKKPVPKKKTPEPLAEVFVPPFDDGPSTLDNLDPAKIPASERFDWQPKELVAVIGTHNMRHWGPVTRIVYSPKGDLVASVGADGVRIWDTATMVEKAFIRHRNPGIPAPESVGFHPDGRKLILYDGGIAIYDIGGPAPKEVARLNGYCFVQPFTPDGKQLVLRNHGGPPHRYEVWDISGEKPTKVKTASAVAASNSFFTLGNEKVIDITTPGPSKPTGLARLIDLGMDGGKVLAEVELFHCAAASPDGRWFACGAGKNNQVRVYDVSGGTFAEKGTFVDPATANSLVALAFLPGIPDELFYTDSSLSHGTIRNVKTGRTRPVRGPNVFLWYGISPTGENLVIVPGSGTRFMSHDIKPDGTTTVRAGADSVLSVLPAPAANRVMTFEAGPATRRWDLDGAEPRPLAVKGVGTAYGLTVLPDGRVLHRRAANLKSL